MRDFICSSGRQMPSTPLLAPLMLATVGCTSPAYMKYLEDHKNDSASGSTGGTDAGTDSTTDAEMSAGSGTVESMSADTSAHTGAGVETGEGETTGPMTTTTTGSSAFCGDGIINQDFLSSQTFTGDMGTRAGADLACEMMATQTMAQRHESQLRQAVPCLMHRGLVAGT